jgi:hypothetical protein
LDNAHRFKDNPWYGQMLKRMWDGELTEEDHGIDAWCCNSKDTTVAMGTCVCRGIVKLQFRQEPKIVLQVQFCNKPTTTQSHHLSSFFVNLCRQKQVNSSSKRVISPACAAAINPMLRLTDGAHFAGGEGSTTSAGAAARANNEGEWSYLHNRWCYGQAEGTIRSAKQRFIRCCMPQ